MAENNIGALFARIAKIAGLVGGVSKSGKSGDGQIHYKYHSADDIMGHLNKLMAEHGLAIIPNVVDTTIMKGADEIERWLITYEYTIGDIEGNVMTARWTGEAPLYGRRKDGSLFTDDKSLGKAHTYAYKYYLMKLFMVSTVDTDDLDTNVVDKGNQGSSKPAPKNTQKQSTNPDDHLGAKPDTFLSDLKAATVPLYLGEHSKHHDNSLSALLEQGYINKDMDIQTAAAWVLLHRIKKDFGFIPEDLAEILGMSFGDYRKKNRNAIASAYEQAKNQYKRLEMPE